MSVNTESIPSPSAPAPVAGSSVPSWARRAMSVFPLRVWPAAEVITADDAAAQAATDQVMLYVAPGHPTTPIKRGGKPRRTWASSDPRCLRWQVALLLAKVPFIVQPIDPLDAWGPADGFGYSSVPGTLPYLELPTRSRRPCHVPVSAAAGQVSSSELPTWLEEEEDTVSHTEASSSKLQAEARVWISLLETKLMAGVLLQRHDVLLLEWQNERENGTDEPLFHGLIRSHARGDYLSTELKRIHSLSPSTDSGAWGSETFGVSPPSERAPTGTGRVVAAVKTFLSHVSVDGVEVNGLNSVPTANAKAQHAAQVNPAAVYYAASVALEAFVARIAADVVESDALQAIPLLRTDQSPEQRTLAALAFALLHTLLSFPHDERARASTKEDKAPESLRNATVGRWRRTVLDCPALSTWLRTLYSTLIVPQGR